MFSWTEHLREVAAHLHWMAQMPGALEHARLRLRELTREPMYADLPALIRELQAKDKSAP
jgi:hypothetical protein